MLQSRASLPHTMYPFDSSAATYSYGHQPQLGPLTGILSNGSDTQCSVNPSDGTLRRALSMQMPTIDGFGDASSQVISLEFFDDPSLDAICICAASSWPEERFLTRKKKT